MLKEGMIVGERYELISRIGSGGMADVYKAKDHKLNRLVAVKVLKAEFRDDKTFVGKFQKEAQAAAGLAHPNIVNVYDVGEENNVNFIVMELVEGITLKDYITKKGKLSVKEATSIAIQVSLGLEAAHNSNIIHRDVKPQNIIISTDGKVKLSDFGIARAASSNTISSNVMVSVHYSSPEQVRGGYSDKKSDIYSLGVTMYEMVTGKVPFDGDTSVSIAIKHLQEEMVNPSQYTPNLPHSFEQIILKCTQKSVDRRYSALSEVIDDLKRSLVDPNGDFVQLAPLASHAQTVMISKDDMEAIKAGTMEQPSQEQYAQPETDEADGYEEDSDEDDDEDRDISTKLEKAMTIGGFVIGAIIICILIYFIGAAAGIFNFGSDKKDDQQVEEQVEEPEDKDDEDQVVVPDVAGKTVEEAQAMLNELSLGMTKGGEEASDEFTKGQIIRLDVAAGEKVKKHTTMEYILSTGETVQDTAVIPNVIGQSQAEAESALLDLGLETVIDRQYSNEVAAGKVISMTPDFGTEVSKGETVTLVVSRGEEGKQVNVPSVVGLEENVAKTTLSNQGLIVTAESGTSNKVALGEVYEQSIQSGTQVDSGTEITIKINGGATTETATPEAAPESEPTASNDDGGATAPVSGNWTSDKLLQVPSEYVGKVAKLELQQEVNGQIVSSPVEEGIELGGSYPFKWAGADGVTTGTVVLYVLENGEYVGKYQYTVPFQQG